MTRCSSPHARNESSSVLSVQISRPIVNEPLPTLEPVRPNVGGIDVLDRLGRRRFDEFTWDTPRSIETYVRMVELSPDLRCYLIHMKRTSLVLDEELLEEAVRVFGVKTYSATVNLALKEALCVRLDSRPCGLRRQSRMAWRSVRDAQGFQPVAWTAAADDPRRHVCVDQGIESTVLALEGIDGPVVS